MSPTPTPAASPSNCVFIAGFDFGTMEHQIREHCAAVGKVLSVEMLGKGECIVQFASPVFAQAAIADLNKTIIAGNQRYIDVRDAAGPNVAMAGPTFPMRAPPRQAMIANARPAMTARSPDVANTQVFNNPGAVFIVGFDFGTTEEQIWTHCAGVGRVVYVEMLGRGECVVQYDSPYAAQAALAHLNRTTIAGNSRYIDVRLDVPRTSRSLAPAPAASPSNCVFIA